MTVKINESTFQSEVKEAAVPVLVDFYAEWCGPCKMMAPTLEEMSETYSGKIKICKCDVDQNTNLAAQFGVSAVPTLVWFKNGEKTDLTVGALSKADLVRKIEGAIR